MSVVERFLKVGFYSHGGAISNARANPGKSPGQIAQETQGSAFGSRYEQQRKQADHLLAAYGGAGGTSGGSVTADRTVTVVKRYGFSRGSVKKRESSWTAAQRLAEEVQWRAFMNEGRFFFVSEEDLYRAKPKLSLSLQSPGVTTIDFDADQNIAVSEATIECRADMWTADPGSVVTLENLGRASAQWLVASMRRGLYDRDTTIALKQPMKEKPEPAPETDTRTIPGTKGRGSSAGAGKGGAKGKVVRDDSLCRGVGLRPAVIEFLEIAAGHLGKPIHVTTSTCHDRLSGSGLVSDHWAGNAADLGSVRNGFAVGGPRVCRQPCRRRARARRRPSDRHLQPFQLEVAVQWAQPFRASPVEGRRTPRPRARWRFMIAACLCPPSGRRMAASSKCPPRQRPTARGAWHRGYEPRRVAQATCAPRRPLPRCPNRKGAHHAD